MALILDFPSAQAAQGMGFFPFFGRRGVLRFLRRRRFPLRRRRRRFRRPEPRRFRFGRRLLQTPVLNMEIARLQAAIFRLEAREGTPERTALIEQLRRRIAFLRAELARLSPTPTPTPEMPIVTPTPIPTPTPPPPTRRITLFGPGIAGMGQLTPRASALANESVNGILYPIWSLESITTAIHRAGLNKKIYLEGYVNPVPASAAIAKSWSFRYGKLDALEQLPAAFREAQVTPTEAKVAELARREIIMPQPESSPGAIQVTGEWWTEASKQALRGITGGMQIAGILPILAVAGVALLAFGGLRR